MGKAGTSLALQLRRYLKNTTARVFVISAVLLALLRSRLDPLSWLDLVTFVTLAGAQPLIEWAIHRYLLHLKPFRVLGRTFDLATARSHREHHADPGNPRWWPIPLKAAVTGTVLVTVLAFLVAPTPGLAVTGLWSVFVLTLFYEWTHFMTHTDYRPTGRWLKQRKRKHLLHHFKNENYWMGVTSHLGDVVLGTNPHHSEVPTSPTARTLGA